jgi:hypothetical protein
MKPRVRITSAVKYVFQANALQRVSAAADQTATVHTPWVHDEAHRQLTLDMNCAVGCPACSLICQSKINQL